MKNFLDDQNAAYDALAKRVLSRKAILAQVLKFSVKEFADCTLEDIEDVFIESKFRIVAIFLEISKAT